MAHSLVLKSTLKLAEIPPEKLRRIGILTVCSDTDVIPTSGEKIQYTYSIIDFTDDIIKNLKEDNIFNTEITQKTIEFNNHTIMEKICTWCDKSEVDIILIIGFPCNVSSKSLDYDPSAIDKMVAKTFENIIDKRTFKRYATTGPKIKEKLESKNHRIMCGERNEKLIINLFGMIETMMNYSYIQSCLNAITKTLDNELLFPSSEENDMNIANLKESSSLRDESIRQVYHEHKVKGHKDLSSVSNIFLNDKKDAFDVKPSFSTDIKNLPNQMDNCSYSSLLHEFMKLNDKKDAFDVKSSSLLDLIKNSNPPNQMENCLNSSLSHEFMKSFATNQVDIDKKSLPEVTDKMELEDITPNTQYDMIPIEEALCLIREIVALNLEKEYEQVDINDAIGRILCEHVYSKCNVPAFRVSTKHGYAVLANDNEVVRRVLNKTTSDPISLSPGTCVWVKSGDRIPDEATAVVKVKDAKQVVSHEATNNLIRIMIKPEFGQNIKDVGSDIPKDKLIITPHIRLGPAEIGLLAATNWEEVLVAKRISVGVFSIGDLLEDPENSLKPGYVYDSSRISLVALLKEKRFMLNQILDFGIVTEDVKSIMDKINAALKQVDVLVTIGCVNDHDVLKTVLRDHLGASIHFGNVDMKPGKSTTFATCKVKDKTKYLLCLSRNPVSSLISAQVFLIPLLDALCHKSEDRQEVPVCINQQYTLHPRPRVAWSSLQWNIYEKIFACAFGQENVVNDKLFSSQGANALLMLPPQKVDCKMIINPGFVSALSLNPN